MYISVKEISISILAVITLEFLPILASQVGEHSYFVSIRKLSWQDAMADCATRHGSLAIITNQTIQDAVSLDLTHTGTKSAWIGGKTEKVDWHWTDGTVAGPQGCWHNTVTNEGLDVSKGLVTKSPDECIDKCTNYKYAGIRNSSDCFCGDLYGSLGGADDCDRPCTRSDEGDCGGRVSNSVFYVKGTWAGFSFGQPQTKSGAGLCGVADILVDYMYKSVNCTEKLNYMCQLEKSRCRLNRGRGEYFTFNDRCVYVGSNKNWFEARADCYARGGDLMKVDSKALHESLQKRMRELHLSIGMKYFIGLTDMEAKWINAKSENTEMVYTAWGPDGFKSEGNLCVMAAEKDKYSWTNAPCDQKKYYVCQIKNIHRYQPKHTTPIIFRAGEIVTEDPNTILGPSSDNKVPTNPEPNPEPSEATPLPGAVVAILCVLTLVAVGGILIGVYFYKKSQGWVPFSQFDNIGGT